MWIRIAGAPVWAAIRPEKDARRAAVAAELVVTTPDLLPSLSTMWAEVTRPKVAPMSAAMNPTRSALAQKVGMLAKLTVGSAAIAMLRAVAGMWVAAFRTSVSVREAGAGRRPRVGTVIQVAAVSTGGGGGGGGGGWCAGRGAAGR